ncbi:MAG: toll/interleukin-1 receptor domain-containing protein [Thermoanaerobaculia bacterium]
MRIFISYSHDSDEHKAAVLEFSNQLRSDGIDVTLDQHFATPPEGWPSWAERQIKSADYVLVVCSEKYAHLLDKKEPEDANPLGVRFEYIYLQGIHRFIPIVFSKVAVKYIPPPLLAYEYYLVSSPEGYQDLCHRLTRQSILSPAKEHAEAPTSDSEQLLGINVFLCHSSKDKPAVRELYRKLGQNGAQPWLDEEDLLPGQKWEQEIPRAVKDSHAVIVCLSDNAVNRAGYFHKEISFALDILDRQPENSIYLIPVKIGPSTIPDRLKHLHCVDITNNTGFKKLLQSLLARANQLHLGSLPPNAT